MAVIEIRCFCICRLCISGAAGPSVVEAVAAARFATAARLSLGYHQPSSYHLYILKTFPRGNLQCQANQGSFAWVSSLWAGRGSAGGQTGGWGWCFKRTLLHLHNDLANSISSSSSCRPCLQLLSLWSRLSSQHYFRLNPMSDAVLPLWLPSWISS